VFHCFVETEAASGGGNDPTETLFVVKRDSADVSLRVVDLLAGDHGIWNYRFVVELKPELEENLL
jgi:hypothetical protein